VTALASPDSPRLTRFVRAVARRGTPSLDRAWAGLLAGGWPIVEPVPGATDRFRVTFAWRPRRPSQRGSVYTPVAGSDQDGDWFDGTRLIPLFGGKVLYRSLSVPRGCRALYAFSTRPVPGPTEPPSSWGRYMRSTQPDPHCAGRIDFAKDPEDPEDIPMTFSVLEAPGAPRQSWMAPTSGANGSEEVHRLRSRRLANSRPVWVFLPEGYRTARRRPDLVIAMDGPVYVSSVPTPAIVRNLVAAGRLPPAIVVVLGNARDARNRDLSLNPAFPDFLALELLPWLRRRYRFTPDPDRTVVAGSSAGGLAAAFAAYRWPDRFRNVLAQSGAFQVTPEGAGTEPGWLIREFARRPRLPLRFYLDVGTLEWTGGPRSEMSILTAVRHLRDVLVAKGYPLTYSEFEGGHDYACWRGTLADGLLALLGRSPPRRRPGK
jgi:enterochelin esterase-like enzyme